MAALHGLQGGLPRRCATRNDGVCLAMKAFRHATAHGLWLPTCRVAVQMCRVCGGACCRVHGAFLRDGCGLRCFRGRGPRLQGGCCRRYFRGRGPFLRDGFGLRCFRGHGPLLQDRCCLGCCRGRGPLLQDRCCLRYFRGRGPFLRDEMMLFTTQCGFFYFYTLLLAEHI